MRAVYRAGQFWRAVTSVPDQTGIELAQSLLSLALQALFLKMQPSETNHSLEITRRLTASGETDPDLLAGALLHDVGKSRSPLNVWERAVVVLTKRFFPGTLQRWGASGETPGWKRIFVVAEQHPAWGAVLAASAGASHLTVNLIRRHQERCIPVSKADFELGMRTREDYFLYQLQLLDEES